jgi:hypothetical protein
MRSVTNAILLLVALLSILGIYVLREHSYRGSQKRFAQQFGSETLKAANLDTSYQKRAVRSVHKDGSDARNVSPVEISVVVIPIVPKLPTDAIHVGMDRMTLRADFAQPDVMISSREDECFLETYIYLENTVKETVIRLINGRVASVSYQENEAIRTSTPSS